MLTSKFNPLDQYCAQTMAEERAKGKWTSALWPHNDISEPRSQSTFHSSVLVLKFAKYAGTRKLFRLLRSA